jgi:hypothetical protein
MKQAERVRLISVPEVVSAARDGGAPRETTVLRKEI